jgi:cysteine synthase A
VCLLADRLHRNGETGSLVTLICDSGERYANSYYDDAWLRERELDPSPFEPRFEALLSGEPFGLDFEEANRG